MRDAADVSVFEFPPSSSSSLSSFFCRLAPSEEAKTRQATQTPSFAPRASFRPQPSPLFFVVVVVAVVVHTLSLDRVDTRTQFWHLCCLIYGP